MYAMTAAELCLGILEYDYHRPFVNGKANRDNIEEMITIGMLNGELQYVDEPTVELAIELVNDLIALYGVKQ